MAQGVSWRPSVAGFSRRACAVGLMLFSAACLAGPPPGWKELGPYAYRGGAAPLNKVLGEFARSFGATLVTQLPAAAMAAERLQAPTPEAFLDRLALDHQFSWFFYNNRLYVSPASDRRTERLAVRDMATADVKQALIGVGLFEPKFGWGEMQDDEAVLVSGPSEYLRLVRQAIGIEPDPDESDTMVFHIRYAFLEDRQIDFRDKTVRIPGLVSVLRSLAGDARGEPPPSDGGGAGPSADSSRAARTGAKGADAPPPRRAAPTSALPGRLGKREGAAVIEADIRTNTLFVRDSASRRKFYRNLIAKLDVPQQMVEIEAVIIDVERSKLTQLGINWAFTFGGGGGPTSVGLNNLTASAAAAPGTLLINNLARFLAQVRALENEGYAAIAAKPVVMTMQNLSAVIDLTRTVYIKLIGERATDAIAVTAGTMLKVTPQIVQEADTQRQVSLRIDIEDGQLTDATAAGSPAVDRSVVATQMLVADQQSLIVASYNRQSDERARSRVPGASDVPILGRLFRSDTNDRRTRERLFIITPRIVEPTIAQARAAPHAVRLDGEQRLQLPLAIEPEAPAAAAPPAALTRWQPQATRGQNTP